MFKLSKSKKFVLSIFLFLFLFISLYIFLYEYTVSKKSWGVHSYKNFLLENTKEFPRIIFDSGSSLYHSINSQILEEEFNRVVINLGDNGGYPLKYKLLRIAKHANKNDIVILPLEYIHYSYQFIPKSFYDNIFGSLSFYYSSLSAFDRLSFISQTPFSSLFYSFLEENKNIDNSYEYIKKFNDKKRGDFEFVQKYPLDTGTKTVSCEMYILTTQIAHNFIISDIFRENMELLKKIEEDKGIKFILTYPAVVGDNCYSGVYKEKIKNFIKNIKAILKDNNIAFIGELEDSDFDKIYMNNTYYHVIPKARDIRTKRLIDAIKKSNLYSKIYNSKKFSMKLDYKELKNYKKLKTINLKEKIIISNRIKNEKILFLNGWYSKEKWGVWTRGKISKFAVKISNKDISIVIKTRLFSKDKTKIFINNKLLGDYLLDGINTIKIPNSFLDSDTLEFEFNNKNIISPKGDRRELKLGLESIEFK